MEESFVVNTIRTVQEINKYIKEQIREMIWIFLYSWFIIMPIVWIWGIVLMWWWNMSHMENMPHYIDIFNTFNLFYLLIPTFIIPLGLVFLERNFKDKNLQVSNLVSWLSDSIENIDSPQVVLKKMRSIYWLIKGITRNQFLINLTTITIMMIAMKRRKGRMGIWKVIWSMNRKILVRKV